MLHGASESTLLSAGGGRYEIVHDAEVEASKSSVPFQSQKAPGDTICPQSCCVCVWEFVHILVSQDVVNCFLVMRFRRILLGGNETHLRTLCQMTIFGDDSPCDTDSTSRCREFLDSSYGSLAYLVPDARVGGGDAGRAAGGDGFDTCQFCCGCVLFDHTGGVLVRCQGTRTLSFDAVHFFAALCQQKVNNSFCSVQRAVVSARPKEMRERSSTIAKSLHMFSNIHGGPVLGHDRDQQVSTIVSLLSESQSQTALQSLTRPRSSGGR